MSAKGFVVLICFAGGNGCTQCSSSKQVAKGSSTIACEEAWESFVDIPATSGCASVELAL